MQPSEFKYLGLVAVTILILGLIIIVLKWPQGRHSTFSQHVAAHKVSIYYYTTLFSIVLPLLLLFFYGWFMPEFRLSPWFGYFIVLSSITQYASTLIPETGGKRSRYHRALAGVSAISLVTALLVILSADSVGLLAKSLTIASISVMVVVVYIIVRGKGKHSHFLLLQSIYFAAFFLPILFISYLQ